MTKIYPNKMEFIKNEPISIFQIPLHQYAKLNDLNDELKLDPIEYKAILKMSIDTKSFNLFVASRMMKLLSFIDEKSEIKYDLTEKLPKDSTKIDGDYENCNGSKKITLINDINDVSSVETFEGKLGDRNVKISLTNENLKSDASFEFFRYVDL